MKYILTQHSPPPILQSLFLLQTPESIIEKCGLRFIGTSHCWGWQIYVETFYTVSCTGPPPPPPPLHNRFIVTPNHRVDRVPGFFSSRPNWDTPPLTRRRVHVPPSLWFQGMHTKSERGGEGVPIRTEGTDPVVLKVYTGMYFVPPSHSPPFSIDQLINPSPILMVLVTL